MSFTWIPYYKELAGKLLEYRENREKLIQIIYGLNDEFVDFMREPKTGVQFTDIHPFVVYAIFNRLTILSKKQIILEYLKKAFNLKAEIPTDFDGIPSVNPQKSFWGLSWYENNNEFVEQNWNLFETAAMENFDEAKFSSYFDAVLQQDGAKWNISQALFRAFPDKFLSLDESSRNYLTQNGISVMSEKDFNGKSYLEFSKMIKEKLDSKELKDSDFVTLSYNSWINAKDKIEYWLIAPGDKAEKWSEFSKNNEIGIAWDDLGDISLYKNDFEKFKNDYLKVYHPDGEEYRGNHTKQIWDFYKSIKIGDIVFARKGVLQIVGMGKVTSDFFYDGSRGAYTQLRKVDWEKTGEWTYPGQSSRDTVHKLKLEQAMEILKTMNEQKNEKTISLKNLLETNKNLILHGAPGTGKTYTAKDIAAQMICGKSFSQIEPGSDDEKLFNKHTEFVQFHPSYDYSDFVEGLRPIEGESSGEVGFELKNGVFKEFCKTALSLKDDSEVEDEFKKSLDKLINDINESPDGVDVPLISGKGTIRIDVNSYGDGFITLVPSDQGFVKSHSRFFNYGQIRRVYEGKSGYSNGGTGFDNYRKAIVKLLKDKYGLCDYVPENKSISKDVKPYVFIIDEINRGEMSKILGELFFSIDPDYRGTKGKVRTQYANMLKESNDFDDALGITGSYGHFFVPENVYIIGTMNDIDRSVDSMDFAMRRRFTFVELKADECLGMLDNLKLSAGITKSDILSKMNIINAEIEKISGLSSSYDIGGSYFAKLSKYADKSKTEAFESLWNNHLKPLISDYLRGIPNLENKLAQFKEKYDKAGINIEEDSKD